MVKSLASGIYRIVNTATGKAYIGSACNLSRREKEHWRQLGSGSHTNNLLQRAWNKYGKDAFAFEQILSCDKLGLIVAEQELIDLYQSANRDFGYNIAPLAGSTAGVKASVETRAKQSAAKKGRPAWNKGVKQSPEQRQATSDRQRGKKQSDETKSRRSAALRGRKPSPEAKASRLDGLRTPESRAKISASQRGRTHSPEHVDKVAAASRGAKRTEDSRRKMSDSAKNRSPEAKANVAAACRANIANPALRAKISATLTGRQLSPGHVLNMARGHALLSHEQANEIRDLRASGWKRKQLAEKFHCSESTIKNVITPKRGSLAYRPSPV